MDIRKNILPFSKLEYSINPPFGSVHIPLMLWFDINIGEKTPKEINIEPLADLSFSPFCSTLHYGQSIFEGMKAFRTHDDKVGIFRPDLHAQRFSRSAKTMAMVDFPAELFLDCLITYVESCKDYVPREPGHSLYLRPLLIANDPVIKLKSSRSYRFIIMSSVAGSYFDKNVKGQRALINKSFIRAFPGGTGEAKTSANYAMSMRDLNYAYANNFDQVLYVDAIKKEKIEELGGMNFFMVKNGELYTPKLDGQILHGVTRQSILEVADLLNIKRHEETVLLSDITDGLASEVFASGTASSVTPIAELGLQEHVGDAIGSYKFENHEMAMKLGNYLLDTKVGLTELSAKWLHLV